MEMVLLNVGTIRTVLLCQGSNNDLDATNRSETWTYVTVAFDARLMRNVIDGRVYVYRERIVDVEECSRHLHVYAYEDQDNRRI